MHRDFIETKARGLFLTPHFPLFSESPGLPRTGGGTATVPSPASLQGMASSVANLSLASASVLRPASGEGVLDAARDERKRRFPIAGSRFAIVVCPRGISRFDPPVGGESRDENLEPGCRSGPGGRESRESRISDAKSPPSTRERSGAGVRVHRIIPRTGWDPDVYDEIVSPGPLLVP